jgi:hypothetical protein
LPTAGHSSATPATPATARRQSLPAIEVQAAGGTQEFFRDVENIDRFLVGVFSVFLLGNLLVILDAREE